MSRHCDGTAGQHLDLATAYPATTPLTFSCWVRVDAIGVNYQLMNLGDTGDTANRLSLSYQSSDVCAAQEKDATTLSQALASVPNADITNFHLYTVTFTSHSSRSAFFDGTNKGTSALGPRTPAAPNAFRISGDCSGANRLAGYIAHAAVWDIDLSDAEILSLYTNEPRFVQPAHLIHYWPMNGNQSPEPDLGLRGEPLIVTGATYSANEPAPVNWLQEAGLMATIIRGVAG